MKLNTKMSNSQNEGVNGKIRMTNGTMTLLKNCKYLVDFKLVADKRSGQVIGCALSNVECL
jgi:hypothetical protein